MRLIEQSDESPRGYRVVQGALRLIVAMQCFAVAARRLDGGLESPIGGVVYFNWGWSEAAMLRLEDVAAWAMLAAGVLTLVRPCWPVLLGVAAWMMLIPLAAWRRDEGFIPAMEPVDHAVRYAGPLALALMAWWPPRLGFSRPRTLSAMWLLRLAAAATFIGHGIAALNHYPHFIDLILTAGDRLVSVDISEDTARAALTVIGIVDIAVAINLLIARLPAVALWMAFWGFVTAGSRIVYFGLEQGYPETLIRIANGGAPLVLALAWLIMVDRRPPTTQPDPQRNFEEEPSPCDTLAV